MFIFFIFIYPCTIKKIDRILERFAQRYTELNHDVFQSGDVAYILSDSIILSHAKVKKKTTKEEFINSNRSATKEEELSPALLSSIYDNGKSEFGEKRKEPTSMKEKMEASRAAARRFLRDVENKMHESIKDKNILAINVLLDIADKEGNNLRVFCSQKIVEISTFNMDHRVRFVWLTIWKIPADHFCLLDYDRWQCCM